MPKWFPALILLGAGTVGADIAGLRQVQTVYLLPMGYGLDQYLANRLTAEAIFQVVTDPSRADAVMTDNIGLGFERRFDELFPKEKPASEKPAAEEASKEGPARKSEMDPEEVERLKRSSLPPISSFSRGKGNVFLVDVKSKSVVWSLYQRPKIVTPDELDRTSSRIVQQLKKDRAGK